MSWLDSYFMSGYKTLQIGGVAVTQEMILNLAAGASAVDNPGLGRTDVTISGIGLSSSTIHRGNPNGMGDANFTVTETLGTVWIGTYAVFTAVRSVVLPTSPTAGMTVVWSDEVTSAGGSILNFGVTFNGGTNNVMYGVTSASTYTATEAVWGGGSVIQLVFNGTLWKVS